MTPPKERAMTTEARNALALCPRCKGWAPADIGAPFTRPDGTWEWVQVRPHEHRTTGRSICKPKGYARPVTPALDQGMTLATCPDCPHPCTDHDGMGCTACACGLPVAFVHADAVWCTPCWGECHTPPEASA